MKILIIKLGAIGDVVRTTSILHGLKSKYKDCKIEWVVEKASFDILKNNKLINKIYLIDKCQKSKIFDHTQISRFSMNMEYMLQKRKYDLLINLDDDYEACEFASSIKSKKLIGAYLEDGKRVYTSDSALWFNMGLISAFGRQKADSLKAKNKKTYQEIIYNILRLGYKKQEPILILNKNDLGFSEKFAKKNDIKKNDLVVGINTGAGGRWWDKKLGIEKTAELIDKLNKTIKNINILLFGGPEEKERNKKIKEIVKTNIIDAGCDNSLMEFASLVDLCKILVTSDSLALHIGIALKKKIVAFFCPTPAAEIELYGRGIKITPKVGCLCCYKPKCDIPPVYEVNDIVNAVKKLI